MKAILRIAFAATLILSLAEAAFPQLGMFSKDQRLDLTREWKGDRFPDGRPKVPDSVLAGLSDVDAEEAWGVLQSHGFKYQFEGGWREVNPGGRMVGRVFTAVFMPQRPDVNAVINDKGKAEGRVGAQNSWPIDMLVPGDVLVVDLFGKIKDGTYAGDNLSTAIFAKSHNGLVVDGAVRDFTGISEIKGMHVFVRDFDPSALRDTTLMGINVPIRIGHVLVMPGDVAVSDPEGITFIPPQLAQDVIDKAQMTHAVDDWGHQMLREGKYTPGEIDRKWSKPMIQEFNKWLEQKGLKLHMSEE
ncbi:MAG: RraA family protein [Terriglobia bacterium]